MSWPWRWTTVVWVATRGRLSAAWILAPSVACGLPPRHNDVGGSWGVAAVRCRKEMDTREGVAVVACGEGRASRQI